MPRLFRAPRLAVAAVAALSCATVRTAFVTVGGLPTWRTPSTTLPTVHETALNVAEGNFFPGGVTLLMAKAHEGDVAGLKELLAAQDDINAQDAYGWTALRYAVRSNKRDAAAALLAAGADPNIASSSGRTPLMSAAGNGLLQMVELLVNEGKADLLQHDERGRTAFDVALRAETARREQAILNLVSAGLTGGKLRDVQMKQYSTQVPL
eukprot:TRINITY_DN1167_c0_g3_i1.p1 TRINITY_DN1167_c0_g3~~TRINITY_DN1167_c0_g3_i1.p1  ORF type:complete len:209 (+),score=53.12 TRINITY_DN1167_c0_g3_i1:67-693(+)